jgi:hypothetical protein
MAEATEQWRPVVGWEGLYEVSDQGRVRSLDRWVTAPNRWGSTTRYRKPGRVLAVKRKKKSTHAYAVVILSRDAVPKTRAVHALVLEAWVGPRPPGAWARHGPRGLIYDGVSNLSWGTPKENGEDRRRDGHHRCPWGHRLDHPNLDLHWWNERGSRRCRACALTTNWGTARKIPVGSDEWLVEAHRRYEEILHFGEPINYRTGRPRWTPGDTQGWPPPSGASDQLR